MVTALIFAGGTGVRMNSRSKPKQFLELHGKPIIVYTLEHFEYCNRIDDMLERIRLMSYFQGIQ